MTKHWFITGTSKGFGREWAIAALERGDRVAATARDTSTLDDLVSTYGDAVVPMQLDVTDHALDYRLLADRTALWNTSAGTTFVTRPAEPQIPTPVPPHLIDPDDCPF